MCWRGHIAPRSDNIEHLQWDVLWQQECHLHSEKQYGIPSDSEEDPCGKSGGCQSGVWATDAAWNDRHIAWGPRHPDVDAYHRAKAGKTVWEVRFEWLGILATGAGRFYSVTPGWAPWHFLLRTLWAWLHSLYQNMWLKSLMMPHLKNDLGGFLCHWWKKSMHTYKRCWIQAWFAPARVCGVTLWYWFERRMRDYPSG